MTEYRAPSRANTWPQTFATEELNAKTVTAIARSRMHPRHRKLDALLSQNESDVSVLTKKPKQSPPLP
jgi:hypothetical protein